MNVRAVAVPATTPRVACCCPFSVRWVAKVKLAPGGQPRSLTAAVPHISALLAHGDISNFHVFVELLTARTTSC